MLTAPFPRLSLIGFRVLAWLCLVQVADENGLEIARQLDATRVGTSVPAAGEVTAEEDDALSRRLAQLRSA